MMRFVRFKDVEGKDVFVNPDRVDCILLGEKGTLIFIGGSDMPTGVSGSPEEAAVMLITGMFQ
jgi:hypothetical protein